MQEANTFGTLVLQLGIDVAAQVLVAMGVAYAWEFERRLIWWDVEAHPVATDLLLLLTGLSAGALGVLAWPDGYIARNQVLEVAALISPAAAGFTMYRAGAVLRARGYEPPALLAVHAVTIFVVGVALVRAAMFGQGV